MVPIRLQPRKLRIPRFCHCRLRALLITACTCAIFPWNVARAEQQVIWSLGDADGSAIEFAPGSQKELVFKVGESVVSRDFSGYQEGSQGLDLEDTGENPYTIEFDLEQPLADSYQLVVDVIFHYGAPEQIGVDVNGKRGIFPVRPEPKQDNDSVDGNLMLLAKQRLVVPIRGDWLKPLSNRITIAPLGRGAMHYDSLSLQAGPVSEEDWSAQPQLEPTLFYVRSGGALKERCRLLVPFEKNFKHGTAKVVLGAASVPVNLDAEEYDFGVLSTTVKIPPPAGPTDVELDLELDGAASRTSHAFVPAKRWKIFICPKIHNDVGYTDLQPHVNELDTRNTDTVLSILKTYPFYKFNFETAWLVENFLDCRPAEYGEEFFARAAEGRAAINAFYLNLLTGTCTGEELYRSMYYTHKLHLEHGSNFNFACLTDAPSHSWFLPTLLTDVGIKAFSNGSNQGRAPILVHSDLNERSPFYWEGMNGEHVMMWYARVYAQLKMLTAQGYISPRESYEYLKLTVPQFLIRYLRDDYVPDAVMIYGAYIDNAAIPETGEAEYIERWNKEFAYPQLLVSSDADYFAYIEQHFADKLPVFRGDAGAYWEDGVASTAEATSWNRQSQQILPVAETSSSFATIFEPRFRYPAEDFRAAWRNVLFYDEHTWGAFNSTSQPDREGVVRQWEVKESYARRANLDARNLLARSLNRLCQQMAVDENTIFVFNWQTRPRTAPVETELGEGSYLVDLATGEPVPLDTVLKKDGYLKVRFLAEDVPAMGFRGYEVRLLAPPGDEKEEEEKKPDAPQKPNWSIENAHYRLTVDEKTGAVQSLVDKAAGRELADQEADYGLNEYLYVRGGDDSLILNLTFGSAPAELTIDEPNAARLVENVRGPFGQRIVVETSATNTPLIRSEYRIYDDLKRVDIVNTFTKEETRDKEAVYFAFPLATAKPDVEYQIQNGWIRPNSDQLPGACREWFTPQNLVHVLDGDYSVAWSTREAPLVTLVDINRGKWLSHLDITNGHVFSYVMNNYWFTNYRATQGGTLTFHYSLTSGNKLSREQLADFDVDTRTPMLVYPYLSSFSARIHQQGRRLDAGSGTLLELDAPNLQLVMLKAAEDGDGYILRVLETAGKSGQAVLKSPLIPLQDAYLCNGVEVNEEQLSATSDSVTFPYKPQQFTTVRLRVGEPPRPN